MRCHLMGFEAPVVGTNPNWDPDGRQTVILRQSTEPGENGAESNGMGSGLD